MYASITAPVQPGSISSVPRQTLPPGWNFQDLDFLFQTQRMMLLSIEYRRWARSLVVSQRTFPLLGLMRAACAGTAARTDANAQAPPLSSHRPPACCAGRREGISNTWFNRPPGLELHRSFPFFESTFNSSEPTCCETSICFEYFRFSEVGGRRVHVDHVLLVEEQSWRYRQDASRHRCIAVLPVRKRSARLSSNT